MNEASHTRLRPYPWQESSWQRLLRAVADERLAHGLLLTGRRGSGRGRFAEAAARYLLCASPQPEGNCGICKSCTLAQRGGHPDLYRLAPEASGKRIGVDAVRELLAFMAKTSALGARKVILVSALDAFTHSAFNAFLKGLEEPADNSYLLMVAARGQYLPATIRSRCQAMPLAAPQPEEARLALADSDIDATQRDAATKLLEYLPGQPLTALDLATNGQAEALLALHQALGSGNGSSAQLAQAAALLPEALLLDALQWQSCRRAKAAAREGDRGRLRRSLLAADRLLLLDDALRSGSNPNPELLRSAALRATVAGEGEDSDKLRAKPPTDLR